MDLKGFKGFCLISGDLSIEAKCIIKYCLLHDIFLKKIPDKNIPCPDDLVPSGSVEWCLKSLNQPVVPDYYPEWLSAHLYRKVWKADTWPLKKVFIKPSDRDKRFTGFVTSGTYRKKKKPPFWCSEIVRFENEWRYYISNGEILCGEWYWGDEVNTPNAPELNIDIPPKYCGAIDFGRLTTGELALVEANTSFACGWYGEEDGLYMKWLVDGWAYIKNKF
jgi:hypothetical protein